MTRRGWILFALLIALWLRLPIDPVTAQGVHQQARQSDPPVAAQQAPPAGAQAPAWIPLPPDHAKYVDDVLKFWEFKSSQIERYRCDFKRYEYDPAWVGDPKVPKTYAVGKIKYAAPDKGLFKVDVMAQVKLPLVQGEKPKFTRLREELNEHWICDGRSIFQFDGHNQQLIQRELPPEMQGKQIAEGPLPFLFNAKAETIKKRYWIRAIIPPPREKVYWLEAVPKTREDAANFRMVHIIITDSGKEFWPEGLVLFHRNNAKTTFVFEQRECNWNDVLEKLNYFHREFFEPDVPSGWKKVVQRHQAPRPMVPVSQPTGNTPQQAQRARASAPRR
jgi:TIGR03009 family protein